MAYYYGQQYPTQYQQYPNQMQQQLPNQLPTQIQSQPQPQPQIQNGGFVSVRSEIEAFNYPVALGNSVTFKDENAPFIYVKTRGFSQLESPIFEKYRLVKEEDIQKIQENQQNVQQQQIPVDYVTHKEIESLQFELDALKAQLTSLTTPVSTRKEIADNETTNS